MSLEIEEQKRAEKPPKICDIYSERILCKGCDNIYFSIYFSAHLNNAKNCKGKYTQKELEDLQRKIHEYVQKHK